MSADPSTDWTDRLQDRAGDALRRLVASMLDAQRVLTQLPAVTPQQLAQDVSRYWQTSVPGSYQHLADGGARYLARLGMVLATYSTAWLRDALPDHRLPGVGVPPRAPAAPLGVEPQQWLSWYATCAAWSTQQQAWAARALTALREEVAAGSIGEQELQASAQRFLEDRLPNYLADVAELGMDLVTQGLAVTDQSIQDLAHTVLGGVASADLVVDVQGPAGSTASTAVAIENNRDEPADVRCTVRSTGPHPVTVQPTAFRLPAGRTKRISIQVTLPDLATEGPVAVGRVQVSGHGNAPLSLRVRATALPPRSPITVRTLGPAPGAARAAPRTRPRAVVADAMADTHAPGDLG